MRANIQYYTHWRGGAPLAGVKNTGQRIENKNPWKPGPECFAGEDGFYKFGAVAFFHTLKQQLWDS